MKHLKIILVMIGVTSFSACTSTKYINTHVNLESESPCVFEKYTIEERSTMTESVGSKTLRNQNTCRTLYIEISDIIQAHNDLHRGQ